MNCAGGGPGVTQPPTQRPPTQRPTQPQPPTQPPGGEQNLKKNQ